MKPHGHKNGQSISVNGSGGQSHLNEWKAKLASAAEGVPAREFRPLVSWPAIPHQHQDRLDAEKAIKSRFA